MRHRWNKFFQPVIGHPGYDMTAPLTGSTDCWWILTQPECWLPDGQRNDLQQFIIGWLSSCCFCIALLGLPCHRIVISLVPLTIETRLANFYQITHTENRNNMVSDPHNAIHQSNKSRTAYFFFNYKLHTLLRVIPYVEQFYNNIAANSITRKIFEIKVDSRYTFKRFACLYYYETCILLTSSS